VKHNLLNNKIMKKFISPASIGHFPNMVSTINRTANFIGLDDDGKAMYDPSLKKPVHILSGTVKLHGTFAGFCYNEISGFWTQSKKEIITPKPEVLYKVSFEDETHIIVEDKEEKFSKEVMNISKLETHDNAGFSFWAYSKKDVLIDIIKTIAKENDIDLTKNTILLCSEWAGKGVQGKVAISNFEKSSFIFSQAKVSPFDSEKTSTWISTNKIDSVENRIFNIGNFKTYEIEIDFNVPKLAQNKIIEMTLEVEEECPVSKELGHVGIGEGIVFSKLMEDGVRHIFKSKGEKHSGKSKVKTLKKVDNEKINKIIEVAEKVTPSWRLEQMLSETFDFINGGHIDRSKLGDYIRAVINDVIKEDSEVISDAGLSPKDVNKCISQISRDYFFDYEKSNLGV